MEVVNFVYFYNYKLFHQMVIHEYCAMQKFAEQNNTFQIMTAFKSTMAHMLTIYGALSVVSVSVGSLSRPMLYASMRMKPAG